MGRALDDRPLPVRLGERILKRHGGPFENNAEVIGLLDTDSLLHQQSIDAIGKLVKALESVTSGTPGPEALAEARALLDEYKSHGKG